MRAVLASDAHPHKDTANELIALWITEHVGTMWCAYVFAGIGIGSLVGVFTGNVILALACGAVSSYFLQLVLLPVIMVGQRVQQRHSDLMSQQQFDMTSRLEKKVDAITRHLNVEA